MSKKNYNILSLNGGGIKGLKTLMQLIELEDRLDGDLLSYFDLIAGTSTGGIIAAMLAKGVKARDIKSLYVDHSEKIFKKRFLTVIRNPRYNDEYINNLLLSYFGDLSMNELKVDVLIPAYNGSSRDFVFFKRKGVTENVLVRDAVRATMSAQVYFKPFEINGQMYIDGGNGLNNPSLDALSEAIELSCNVPINLLSIGTGKVERPLEMKQKLIKWLITSTELNMTEAEQLTQKRVEYCFKKKTNVNLNLYCYCDSLVHYSSEEMDDGSKENIENLIKDGNLSYKQNAQKITNFINEIKKR